MLMLLPAAMAESAHLFAPRGFLRDLGLIDNPGVSGAPWIDNVRNLLIVICLLLIVSIAIGIHAWLSERRSRRQLAAMAYVEQRRAKILEHINSSRALAEILEDITELTSVRLRGAPCWCQVTDGPLLGNRPPRFDSASFRVAELPIQARAGGPLGVIHAAFDARTKPVQDEAQGLAMGAAMATLAIETAHLYSDLVRRSEYDLLTDAQNRFSLERSIDEQINISRQNARIFGLLYADLDSFKQVNDLHGHHVGDVYLQEVARRMKHQLRPGDMLARLGGDEFAVVIPSAYNRAQVAEIAHRLERCFSEPFVIEGNVIRGSMSVGVALYPQDGDTRDSLLDAADAAMYAAKNARASAVESSQAAS